ncbi:MAG: hypothetical protein HYZ13_12850 [Acidobacteria bacterium]|nr:hypothetical protein [Acidobacteriota bacterium]
MNGSIILGAIALVLFAAFGTVFLLELRRCSKAMIQWLNSTEQHLGTMAEEAREARCTWDHLATRMEASCEPLIQMGATTRTLTNEVQLLRDRYQEGALSAARKVGGIVQILKSLWSLTHPGAPRGAT